MTYGAILRDLQFPLDGALRRVVLGYRDLAGYLADRSFMGSICGRNANRIAHGRFLLDGMAYRLSCNDGGGLHHLHGGPTGFSKQVWSVVDHGASFVILELTSPDGHEGYPGAVVTRCAFELKEPSELNISLTAQTSAPTLINLAHHSYFTLDAGAFSHDHLLQVNAESYTPVDSGKIPTGEIRPVEGTPYDFRTPARIGDRMRERSLDINFVLRPRSGPAARLWSPDMKIGMDVFTDEPGMQVYDGANLKAGGPTLDGEYHRAFGGICFEPQKFPDAINHPEFPSAIVRPGAVYRQTTRYRFSSHG
jgi:aldose 1-epimerase